MVHLNIQEPILDEILAQTNAEIVENAGLVSINLMSGVFRSLFRVDRATEFAEPDVFDLSDDPASIIDKGLSPLHWRYLPHFISNGDILARRYQKVTDFQFVFVADISPSMGYRWRDVYLGTPGASDNPDFLVPTEDFFEQDYPSTKLYLLKYLMHAFLVSALRPGFSCQAILFTGDEVMRLDLSHAGMSHYALVQLDEHFADPVATAWEATQSLPSPYHRVMDELLQLNQSSIIVMATDFMDLVHGRIETDDLFGHLAELKRRHRLALLQINDPHEVQTLDSKDDLPTSTRWALQRDPEQPDEGGVGQQRFYRPRARNAEFVRHCRSILGWGDQVEGAIAESAAGLGIAHQKFVHGHGHEIERKLDEIRGWLEHNQ